MKNTLQKPPAHSSSPFPLQFSYPLSSSRNTALPYWVFALDPKSIDFQTPLPRGSVTHPSKKMSAVRKAIHVVRMAFSSAAKSGAPLGYIPALGLP